MALVSHVRSRWLLVCHFSLPHWQSYGRRTLVLSRRKMNWKFDFSPETSDILAVDEDVNVAAVE